MEFTATSTGWYSIDGEYVHLKKGEKVNVNWIELENPTENKHKQKSKSKKK